MAQPMYVDNNPWDGTWRDLETGTDPAWDNPEEADGANDAAGTPAEPIYTRLPNAVGLPWWDAVEDPLAIHGLAASPNPQVWSPYEDVGSVPIVGAFEGAFRTRGPIQAFGHEPSGGLAGDQAIGRIMRFPANIPERFDPNGVFNTDIRDDLSAAMMYDDLEYQTEAQITTNLLQWPNVFGRW